MILVNKPLGLSPLQVIKKLQFNDVELLKKKLAYAGRLDPMATGLLVVLEDEECKNRDLFQGLDKTYEFEVLFGIETDTYDSLGIISKLDSTNDKLENFDIQKSFARKYEQPFPPFSSKAVNGKPLYWWTREGKLDEITIPKKMVEIYQIEQTGEYKISSGEILREIGRRVNLVTGDFRQKEILQNWQMQLSLNLEFQICKFTATVSSGTYIRSIAHEMGLQLGTGAIAWKIHRTTVGAFSVSDAISL